jgi:hypothetical protein
MHEHTLSQVLSLLKDLACTPTEFILGLLASSMQSHQSEKLDLINHTTIILNSFSCVLSATSAVHAWVHEVAKTLYMQQVSRLTKPECGFQFNARNATFKKIESFSMMKMEATIQ